MKTLIIFLSFAASIFASPEIARARFLDRNSVIAESVKFLALTSIERERCEARRSYHKSCDIWGLMFDLGRKLPVKSKSEIPEYLKRGHEAELTYLKEIEAQIPKDGYLFLAEIEGRHGASGYLILTQEKTIRSDLVFTIGAEVEIK